MERQTDGEWFSTAANSKILPAGIYRAVLKTVNPGLGKGYGKEETRPTLMFSFLEDAQGVVINRTVTRSNSDKSQLVALVRSLTGPNGPSPSVISSPEAFKEFILTLVGKHFLIQVEPSRDSKFNNLIACFPAPELK